MDITPIKNEKDYRKALKRIEELWNTAPKSPEFDELDVLTTLVEAYEEKHHQINPPDPIDAIIFRMEQLGLSRKDLEPFIGPRGRVAEVLNRKRSMSLAMIRKLHKGLGIPAAVLLSEY